MYVSSRTFQLLKLIYESIPHFIGIQLNTCVFHSILMLSFVEMLGNKSSANDLLEDGVSWWPLQQDILTARVFKAGSYGTLGS